MLKSSFTVTTLSLTIRVYLHLFSSCWLPNQRNHAKFRDSWIELITNSSRSSKVIDLGAIPVFFYLQKNRFSKADSVKITCLFPLVKWMFLCSFNVNRSTFHEDMHKRRFLIFVPSDLDLWPLTFWSQQYTSPSTSVRSNVRIKYQLLLRSNSERTKGVWLTNRPTDREHSTHIDRQMMKNSSHFRWWNVFDDMCIICQALFLSWFDAIQFWRMHEKNDFFTFSYQVSLTGDHLTLHVHMLSELLVSPLSIKFEVSKTLWFRGNRRHETERVKTDRQTDRPTNGARILYAAILSFKMRWSRQQCERHCNHWEFRGLPIYHRPNC